MRKPFFIKARKAWYLDTPGNDGKLQRIMLGKSKKAAYEEWERLKQQASTEWDGDALTIDDLICRYLEAFENDVDNGRRGKSTLDALTGTLTLFSAFAGDGMLAKDLVKHHLTRWLSSMPGWNATTQHHAVERVKRAFNWAVNEGLLRENPIAKVRVDKGSGRDHVASSTEFAMLMNGYKSRRRRDNAFRTILIALRLSACRPGEIPNVDLKNVRDDRWTLPKHKTMRQKKRPRVVYLSPCLHTLSRIAKGNRTEGPLFLSPMGKAWDYQDMRRRFHRLRERTGVSSSFVMYTFRHTWITDALVAGIDVATVAEMAGTSIQMIDRHYGHLSKHKDHMIQAASTVIQSRA
ncbi:tyrosine-type recombinase/integrase [Allorhodopirellula solitaria]|uniref:Site-specific tyrosine recombinase XerC n=1 Tax=Allorhodopirellula solitaria TaxID=2527987 RepID=A0A5C5WPV8_9BACT|nr:tyrosine-type recombinase/integrase [Allorhodopirellula solitaria]TWT52159.1 site-specific tyrosine recombinase XerC [Allorhodopirellula solitaria]